MIKHYCDRCGNTIRREDPGRAFGRFFAVEPGDRISTEDRPTQKLPPETVYRVGLPGTLVGRKVTCLHICEPCHFSLVDWVLEGAE